MDEVGKKERPKEEESKGQKAGLMELLDGVRKRGLVCCCGGG